MTLVHVSIYMQSVWRFALVCICSDQHCLSGFVKDAFVGFAIYHICLLGGNPVVIACLPHIAYRPVTFNEL